MTVLRSPNSKAWTYDFWYLGKRYRKRFDSRSRALKAEAQKRLALNSNPNQDDRITFSSAAQLFFENHSKPSKKVWKEDGRKIEYLNGLFGDKKLTDITSFDIQHMRNNLQEKGLTSATVDKYHALVKTIFNKMFEWKKFSGANPACQVKLKRTPNAHLRYLTYEELRLLEKHIEHDLVFPYYLIALHSGMRRGEVCSLLWENVNMLTRDIYVPISKSGKERHIPMNDILYGFFNELYEKKSSPGKVLDSLSPTYMSRRFIKICKKLGIMNCKFHTLRHTFASHLIMEGVNIHTVSRWLGHASISTTEKHYAHLAPDFQKEEIHQLNKLSIHSQESNRTTLGQHFDFKNITKAS